MISQIIDIFKRERDGKGETTGTMDNQSSRVVGNKGTSGGKVIKATEAQSQNKIFRHDRE